MAGDEDRLRQFKPEVRYDSLEAFFADSCAEMVVNPGNTLRGGATGQPLSLALLTPEGPPRSRLSISGKDYRSQYVRLITAQPSLRDKVYAAVRPGKGADWLQYWFFYFYDDPTLAANLGAHEGDWEMIQLRIPHGANEPDVAVYAQHNYAGRSDWPKMAVAGRPVVYVARGSHASYFEPGLYGTKGWFDVADGEGRCPDLDLEVIDDDAPPWVGWPGQWGDTSPRWPWLSKLLPFLKGLEADSPVGPGAHSQWDHPDGLFVKATERLSRRFGRLPVVLDQVGKRLRVAYDLGREEARAASWLVVNVRSAEKPPAGRDEPPRSFTIHVGRARKGRWIVPWLELEPERAYEVRTSLMAVDGTVSTATCTPFTAGVPRWHGTLIGAIGHAFAKLAQRLRLLRTRLAVARRRR
jgi:hypothetical protein